MEEIKKTAGRRKIEIKKIEEKSKLFVTCSKRKKSLFKKAAETAASCGADVAVLVVTDSGRPFSFGSPATDSVVHRFLNGGGEAYVGGDGADDNYEAVGGYEWLNRPVESMSSEELDRHKADLSRLLEVVKAVKMNVSDMAS